jgi:hypothetical protein
MCSRNGGGKDYLEKSKYDWVFLNDGVPKHAFSKVCRLFDSDHPLDEIMDTPETDIDRKIDVVLVARLEYFRARRFSRMESFRALNP